MEGLDCIWALIGIENEPISLNVSHLSLCFHQEGFLKKYILNFFYIKHACFKNTKKTESIPQNFFPLFTYIVLLQY